MSTLAFSRPLVSSPLADPSAQRPATQRMTTKRNASFPTSRALRPFPTISTALKPTSSQKTVKLIEPPKNFKTTFMLDLTQAELSRRD
ncbi:hypothetical protein BDQ17DRAFT_1340258 [Cyathus striatus]|nr:hypothetical protein BDQ17DRAFT_1340258 [Cyathus striatus]